MLRAYLCAAVAICTLVLALPVHADPVTYELDPAGSELLVRLYKDGALSRFGHDHLIHASTFKGLITLDVLEEGRGQLELEVAVKDLVVDDPVVRKKHGVSLVNESDRRAIRKTMLSDEQLAEATHPTMRFVMTSLKRTDVGHYKVDGELTLKGKRRPVSFAAAATVDREQFKAAGTLKLKLTDFGIEPYSAFLGSVKVKDAFTMTLKIVGKVRE